MHVVLTSRVQISRFCFCTMTPYLNSNPLGKQVLCLPVLQMKKQVQRGDLPKLVTAEVGAGPEPVSASPLHGSGVWGSRTAGQPRPLHRAPLPGRILNVEQEAVSRSYRQLQSSRGSEVRPDSYWEAQASARSLPAPREHPPSIQALPQPHPGDVVIHHHQRKLVALVDLVFCPHKHLNHLLGDIEGIGFGAGEGQRVRGLVKARPPGLEGISSLVNPGEPSTSLRISQWRPRSDPAGRWQSPAPASSFCPLQMGFLWPAWVSQLILTRSSPGLYSATDG